MPRQELGTPEMVVAEQPEFLVGVILELAVGLLTDRTVELKRLLAGLRGHFHQNRAVDPPCLGSGGRSSLAPDGRSAR
jgi:hypothetical protein